ncbi:HisA/HisF-related TIM barrel protein [Ideonella sp. YS5]|uniref:HisA/HisF-related TIM barrel protein n=1 Tax=Ideonella sp. YS5 TaxID=3453714 RepID=UPI003EECF1E2
MTVIPVIDLMQGQVVRGVGGHRSAYRPIVSRLCAGSEPVAVARALCAHCAASQLYVADLDALQGQAWQTDALRALLSALPDVELWLDGGFAEAADVLRLRAALGPSAERVVPVFGSESLASVEALTECFGSASPGEAILSLDRRGARRLDPAGCWDAVAQWPRRVIVMTLERVGSAAGPDLEVLSSLQAQAPLTQFIGAGGIRDQADLDRAREAGATAWLVASALHDGRLSRLPG